LEVHNTEWLEIDDGWPPEGHAKSETNRAYLPRELTEFDQLFGYG
jgi:hypothetical protein